MGDGPPKYMLDTNVFNWLVQGDLSMDELPWNGMFVATPVQRAELKATRNEDKRKALLKKFSEVVDRVSSVPLAFDVPGAGFDQGAFADSKLAELTAAIRCDLDRTGKKANNIQDALIAATAIANGLTLVTGDNALKKAVEANGGRVKLLLKRETSGRGPAR